MATSLKIDSYSIDVNELQHDINKRPRLGQNNQKNDRILIDEGLATPMIHSGGNSLSPKRNKVVIVRKKKKDDGTMTVIDENIYNSIDLAQIEENDQIKNSRNVEQKIKTDEGVSLPAIGNSGRNKMKNALDEIQQTSVDLTQEENNGPAVRNKFETKKKQYNILELSPPKGLEINPQTQKFLNIRYDFNGKMIPRTFIGGEENYKLLKSQKEFAYKKQMNLQRKETMAIKKKSQGLQSNASSSRNVSGLRVHKRRSTIQGIRKIETKKIVK